MIAEPTRDRAATGGSGGLSLLAVMLVCASFGLPFVLMIGKSISNDEVAHIPAGYSYLRTGEIVLNPMHPPLVKELSALPLLLLDLQMPVDAATIRSIGRDFTYQWEFGSQFLRRHNIAPILFWSRIPAVLLSACLAFVVWRWSSELWGPIGGIASLLLYVFDPNITAHAELVTTDVGCALFSTLFFYLLYRWWRRPSIGSAAAAGVALGLGLGAKFSCVFLLPLAALALAGVAFDRRRQGVRSFVVELGRSVGVWFALVAIAVFVVWGIYFFPTDPLFYWHGVNYVKGDHNPQYLHFLRGEFRHGSWLSYFLIAWFVKTPIPALVAIGTAAVAAMRGFHRSWQEEMFVAIPLFGLFVLYSSLAPPLGIRYVIPCLPFLMIAAGRIGPMLATAPRALQSAGALLAVWYVAEFAAIWPDHIAYFNQIAGGSRGGVAWFDDSNVDWGQGYLELHAYLKSHPTTNASLCNFDTFNPAYYGFPGRLIWISDILTPPPPGTLILSSHCVARARAWLASHHDDGPANWFSHIEPRAIVGHVYWIYDIPAGPSA